MMNLKITAKNRILLYPLGLVLFIFIIDKIALIPGLHEIGRKELTPLENMQNSLIVSLDNYSKLKSSGRETRPYVLFLGSSRSEILKYNTADIIRNDKYINEESKKLLNKFYFESRLIIRASNFFIDSYLLDGILNGPSRPDMIVLEMSPEMFNQNNPFNFQRQLDENIFEPEYLKKIYPVYSDHPVIWEIRKKLLFASYNYRFQPQKILSSSASFDKRQEGKFISGMILLGKNVESRPSKNIDFEEDNIPEDAYRERFVGYTAYLLGDFVLRNYVYDKKDEKVFLRLLDVLTEKKIPVVIWIPYVHPYLGDVWKTKTTFYQNFPLLSEEISKRNLPLLDASGFDMKCRRFTDSSHLSPQCSSYMLSLIMQKATEKYGENLKTEKK